MEIQSDACLSFSFLDYGSVKKKEQCIFSYIYRDQILSDISHTAALAHRRVFALRWTEHMRILDTQWTGNPSISSE